MPPILEKKSDKKKLFLKIWCKIIMMMVTTVMMAMLLMLAMMMIGWFKTLGRGKTFALQRFKPELSTSLIIKMMMMVLMMMMMMTTMMMMKIVEKRLILKEITWGSGTGLGHIIKKILGSDIVINVWRGNLELIPNTTSSALTISKKKKTQQKDYSFSI